MICDKWLHIYGNKLGTGINCEWVDAVEVVRCKDCRWWDNEDNAERCTHKYGWYVAKSDGYCSYGERTDT